MLVYTIRENKITCINITVCNEIVKYNDNEVLMLRPTLE